MPIPDCKRPQKGGFGAVARVAFGVTGRGSGAGPNAVRLKRLYVISVKTEVVVKGGKGYLLASFLPVTCFFVQLGNLQ